MAFSTKIVLDDTVDGDGLVAGLLAQVDRRIAIAIDPVVKMVTIDARVGSPAPVIGGIAIDAARNPAGDLVVIDLGVRSALEADGRAAAIEIAPGHPAIGPDTSVTPQPLKLKPEDGDIVAADLELASAQSGPEPLLAVIGIRLLLVPLLVI